MTKVSVKGTAESGRKRPKAEGPTAPYRPDFQLLYEPQLGESVKLLKNGGVLVVHPDHRPKIILV